MRYLDLVYECFYNQSLIAACLQPLTEQKITFLVGGRGSAYRTIPPGQGQLVTSIIILYHQTNSCFIKTILVFIGVLSNSMLFIFGWNLGFLVRPISGDKLDMII